VRVADDSSERANRKRTEMARDIMSEIREEIAVNKVLVYMKGSPTFPMCGFSAATVSVLQELGYPFAHVNILEDEEKRDAIKTYSNWPTIPQLYVDGKFIGGFDIVRELYATGELERVLKDAFAAEPVNGSQSERVSE
jgi:monothiol glutaredoxin